VISVALATVDRPDYLRRALESLLRGSFPPVDVVVVDQSADERTLRVVEEVGSTLIHYEHQRPPCLASARNRAVELASGEYVAIVDDDDEFAPDWLASVSEQLVRHSYPDALFGEIHDGEAERDRKTIPVSLIDFDRPRDWRFPSHPGYMGYGAHTVVKRSTFLALGGFDSRFGPGAPLKGGEDIDFNYRLIKAGYRAVSTPAIAVVHNQPRSQRDLPRYFFGTNHGQAAFCAKNIRAGDRYAWRVLGEQARSDLRMLASAVRRRSWVRARTGAWRAAGTCVGFARGWRAFRTA
jgi:glycosyltransferase involved in cell wall biosynthesis